MSEKELVALVVLTLIGVVCTAGGLLSSRFRDVTFFAVVFGAAFTERMDVNFFSHAWYRGTTRGIEVSPIDMMAFGVMLSSMVARRADGLRRIFWPSTFGLMLVYFGYCIFSVHHSDPQVFGVLELSKIVRGIVLFLCGAFYLRSPRELTLFVLALAAITYTEFLFCLRQRLIWGLSRVAGTLSHPNSLSMYMVLIGPILIGAATSVKHLALRTIFGVAAACAAACAVLSLSRTGVAVCGFTMIGALAFCDDWRFSFKKLGVIGGAGLCAFALLLVLWPKLKERYLSASFADEYLEVQGENRGIYIRWALLIAEDRPFGVGLNNWSYWVSKDYGHRVGDFKYNEYILGQTEDDERSDRGTYAPPAHSLLALTLGELGRPGLALFGLLWLRWLLISGRFLWRRSDPLARWGIGLFFGIFAIFLHSVTEWNYRQTTIMFTVHLAIGAAVALRWLSKQRARAPKSPDSGDDTFDLVDEDLVPERNPPLSRV